MRIDHSVFWKTYPMRTILPIVLIPAALLFFFESAWGGTDRYTKVANQLVELINAGDYAGIQAKFNKTMDAALPLDKSTSFFKGLTQQMGTNPETRRAAGRRRGVVFRTEFEKGTLDMQIVLDSRGLIAGLSFKPHVATKPVPKKHQTQLSLPFKGRWLVFWGGDTRKLNQHHDVPNQRFAFDLLGVGERWKDAAGRRHSQRGLLRVRSRSACPGGRHGRRGHRRCS